jgi:hypothetical protein
LISVVGKLAIVAVAMFVSQIIDNSSARLTRDRMLTFTLVVGTVLVAVNFVIVYLMKPGVM